jgi:hypothetical protein
MQNKKQLDVFISGLNQALEKEVAINKIIIFIQPRA